jgi:N-acetyltransferase 10
MKDIEPRFNERFLLSLSACKNCIIMDDEMNILPIYSSIKEIAPVSVENKKKTKKTKIIYIIFED